MANQIEQLLDQVRAAKAEDKSLNIRGGGSKQFMGRDTAADQQAVNTLEVGGHRGIVDYHPVELVMTARGGTPLTEIIAALDEHDQRLCFEPALFGGGATLAGTLAVNQSGPGRPWSGSVRDMVLGVRLINGEAQELRFGGQVMKNVAGYDLSRFQAGAMGTLGVITEVSLKVLPKPACTRTLKLECDAGEALQTMNRLAGTPKPLTAASWWDGSLYLRLEGAESAVAGTCQQWSGELVEEGDLLWQQLREQQLAFFEGEDPLWRFSINSTAQPFEDRSMLIDWGGSQRWLRGEQDKQQLEAWATQQGGHVSLYRGGERGGEVMHNLPEAIRKLHLRIKHAVDPHGIFNPGRLYSWM